MCELKKTTCVFGNSICSLQPACQDTGARRPLALILARTSPPRRGRRHHNFWQRPHACTAPAARGMASAAGRCGRGSVTDSRTYSAAHVATPRASQRLARRVAVALEWRGDTPRRCARTARRNATHGPRTGMVMWCPLPITWRGAAGAQRVRLRRWGSAPVAARPAAGAHAEDCNADSYSSR